MSATDLVLDRLRARGEEPKPNESGWMARCPAHDDATPSLSIATGSDGRALLKCLAGCETQAVLVVLGLEMRDLFDAPNGRSRAGLRVVQRTVWKILDPAGTTVAEHHRFDFDDGTKRLSWLRDGRKGLQGLKVCDLPLYGLPHLLAASRPAEVIVTEGEKACDALRDLGVLAVATVTGASVAPSAAVVAALAGFDVVLWPDNDDVGRKHMRAVAARLKGMAGSIRWFEWSDATSEGDDAADFVLRGGTRERLVELIAAAPPLPTDEPREVLAKESPPTTTNSRPQIEIRGGELAEIVRAAEAALLADRDPDRIYQRGGLLVRVVRDGPSRDDAIRRARGAPIIVPVSVPYLVLRLTRAVVWLKYDARAGQPLRKDCPEAVAKAMLANRGGWRVPELLAVVETPAIRPDGTILATPGYDAETRLIFDPGETIFPAVPHRLTRADAARALAEIEDVVSDFPYEAATDRSAFVAATLTIECRNLFDLAPIFVFGAPTRRSGKSLGLKVVGIIATGREPAFMAQAEEEEDRKRMLMLALEGDPMAVFDNITRPFGGGPIDMAATSAMVKDRTMREHTSSAAKLVATLFATGNNITFKGDTASRVIPCDLLPTEERPEERTIFKRPELRKWVRANRPRLAVAGVTIVAAYLQAGRPRVVVAPFGGFEEWRSIVPSAIVWAGGADPVAGKSRILQEADPVADLARAVVAAIHRTFDSQEFTVSALVRRGDDDAELGELLRAAAPAQEPGRIDPKRLGECLTRWKKANRGGLRLLRVLEGEKLKLVNKAAAWRVDVVGSTGDLGDHGDRFLGRGENLSVGVDDIPAGATGPVPEDPEVPDEAALHGLNLRAGWGDDIEDEP